MFFGYQKNFNPHHSIGRFPITGFFDTPDNQRWRPQVLANAREITVCLVTKLPIIQEWLAVLRRENEVDIDLD